MAHAPMMTTVTKTAAPTERSLDARDGWNLSVLDFVPECEVRAVAILGHAMMVDRRTLYRVGRPSLAATLIQKGFRVLLPDLRGHGTSGPRPHEGGGWTYDDLVEDTGEYLALARALGGDVPVCLVGHSLFAHTSLAFLGQHPEVSIDAMAGLSFNMWGRPWTHGRLRWWRKQALIAIAGAMARVLGYVPCRRLRLGSADESRAYWKALERGVFGGGWLSADGVDYSAGLQRVGFPVLQVVSDGDTILCRPDDALSFTEGLGDRREVIRLGPSCTVPELRALTPGHMQIVTDPTSEPVWQHIAEWLAARVGEI
jgi:predicted alpha/beta hydrolase